MEMLQGYLTVCCSCSRTIAVNQLRQLGCRTPQQLAMRQIVRNGVKTFTGCSLLRLS
jgi:hypothetical protein